MEKYLTLIKLHDIIVNGSGFSVGNEPTITVGLLFLNMEIVLEKL